MELELGVWGRLSPVYVTSETSGPGDAIDWAAVKERELSFQSPETILFTIYLHYGNLNYVP